MNKDQNPIQILRLAGWVEGISYLVLLGVAMPLKYMWGMPMAVRVVGSIHGLLFVIFGAVLVWAWWSARWGLGRVLVVFGAAMIPFGPWLLERRMRGYEAEYRALRC